MYELLPYFWILFMTGLVVSTIVAAVMGRPKKVPKPVPVTENEAAVDPLADADPVLDFGDELAQMEKK